MSDKYDKIISAILRSSKPATEPAAANTAAAAAAAAAASPAAAAATPDLKIGMVNIQLTADAPSDDRVAHITKFLSVPEKKTDDPNFTERPRILVCFFSDTGETVKKFNEATLKELNEKSVDFEGTPFKENIYIYSNKKVALEVKAVDKYFKVGDHTIYINDTEAKLEEGDYKIMAKGNIILNNNTDTAPTLPDSLPLTLKNALTINSNTKKDVRLKLKEMGYGDTIFPIYEVRDNEESETDPFLTNLCVGDLAVGAVAEAEAETVSTTDMNREVHLSTPRSSGPEGASGLDKYAKKEVVRRPDGTPFEGLGAFGSSKKGGSRSKRNRKGSRGGGRKRKNKRSKKRKYMRSKKRKKLQRR